MADQRPVVIVVDSTADLPASIVEAHGMNVVPLRVQFGDETFLDRVDLSPEEFVRRLRASDELPKTSQPPPTDFEQVFRPLVEAGNDVVCVTIASQLSGTYNAARLAAEAVADDRIRIVDSLSASMSTGFVAIEAAEAARRGETLDVVVERAEQARSRCRLIAVVNTLEYLQKGGRIGRASAMLGSMLNIKPMLSIRDGEVHPIERVRTRKKAFERLVTLAEESAPLTGLAVLGVDAADEVQALADRLSHLVPRDRIVIGDIGPVVATYGGPGCLGFIAYRAE